MIITDMNEMGIEELEAIHDYLGIALEINDGKVVGSAYEKALSPTANQNSASFTKTAIWAISMPSLAHILRKCQEKGGF